MSRSSVATPASTASHRNVRDDRDPPLIRRETRGVIVLICPTTEAECFLRKGWTDFRPDLPVVSFCRGQPSKIVVARAAKQTAAKTRRRSPTRHPAHQKQRCDDLQTPLAG